MNIHRTRDAQPAAMRCARCGNAVMDDDFCADCLDFSRSLNDQETTLAGRASQRRKRLFSASSK
jgi:hypothetical protein